MPFPRPITAFLLLIALAAPCYGQFESQNQNNPFGRGGMMQSAAQNNGTSNEPSGSLLRRPKDKKPVANSGTPVLRQGVIFSSVKGYFAASVREPGLLVFRIDQRMVSNIRRSIFVMPCDNSDDIKAILADPRVDSPTLFEVSGEIYEFHNRAYILPVAIIAMRTPPPPDYLARITPQDLQTADARTQGPRAPRVDAYADITATELAGTPVRSVPRDRMEHEPNTAMFPGPDDDFADQIERQLDAGIAKSDMGTAVKRDPVRYDRNLLMPQASRFQDRRASVLRDPITGIWRARLDTARAGNGAEDGAEISMELLPCQALETLEKAIRQRPIGTPWLLSGEVVINKNRNLLLLSRAVVIPEHKFESP